MSLAHSFNEGQIEWFKAGSALNLMAAKAKASAEDGEEPDAKPARATASRARKPAAAATEPADDADSDEARPAVKQRSSGTARKTASSGSGAAQKEEDDE